MRRCARSLGFIEKKLSAVSFQLSARDGESDSSAERLERHRRGVGRELYASARDEQSWGPSLGHSPSLRMTDFYHARDFSRAEAEAHGAAQVRAPAHTSYGSGQSYSSFCKLL